MYPGQEKEQNDNKSIKFCTKKAKVQSKNYKINRIKVLTGMHLTRKHSRTKIFRTMRVSLHLWSKFRDNSEI